MKNTLTLFFRDDFLLHTTKNGKDMLRYTTTDFTDDTD